MNYTNARFAIITLVMVSLNILILYVFPMNLLYNIMCLMGGTNLVLNGILSFICVVVFHITNAELSLSILRNFNYYLTYIITNGAITAIAPTKEEYFKLLDEREKLLKDEKENK